MSDGSLSISPRKTSLSMTGEGPEGSQTWISRGLNDLPFLGSLAALCTVVFMFAQSIYGPEVRLAAIEGRQENIVKAIDDFNRSIDTLAEVRTELAVIAVNLDTALASGGRNQQQIEGVRDEIRHLRAAVNAIRFPSSGPARDGD